jgi:hypothetical protein
MPALRQGRLVTMWPFLTFLLACGSGADGLHPVSEDAAQSASTAVRQCLDTASRLRSEEHPEKASSAVLACYSAHFEPMERPLRAHNRKATLSLEYEFGRVAGHMAQAGNGSEAIGMAGRLADRVERVLASMPVVSAAADTGGK